MSHPLKIIEILGLPKPEGIIHVGAHFGQEAPAYQAIGTQCCVYIEPIPTAFEKLKCNVEKIPNHFPIQALCSDLDGQKVTFNVSAGDGQSSSVFPLGNIKRLYPRMRYIDELKLETRSLDRIITSEFPSHNFDLLVMDTQGSELNILKGSNGLLTTQLKYIYSEVSTEPLYQGSCNFEEITAFLKLYGFRLKNAVFGPKNWGDAFYAKNFSSQFPTLQDNLALHKPALQSSLSRWSKPDDAQGAVNGTKTGKYGFCTKREANPWWQVDLLSIYKLTEVGEKQILGGK
ncbi:FkbM family methyltransferase [Trichodesmium erythraeum 21-75]|nr:FkbM family methyltransferase [Trichodesmium erythraeum 21-75]